MTKNSVVNRNKINLLVLPVLLFSTFCFSLIHLGCQNLQTTKPFIKDHINTAQTQFAIRELHRVIANMALPNSSSIDFKVEIAMDSNLENQAFKIKHENFDVKVYGGDTNGAMYGLLELAEQISLYGFEGIKATEQKPFIKKRGIKFNIPLDARLPSYDDTGDAAQNNIIEMWNTEFWHAYLDNLAVNRYNVLTLWTKHPFPGLIKLKAYPDVAMNDVYVFNKPITAETEKDWSGIDIQNIDNLKLVKKMTIDEKIAFWQHVMQYAHERGIAIYFFTWNAFVTGAEKYGINPTEENGVTYIRECVKEFVKTYPHVRGIGVTAGERMSWKIAGRTKEKWLYDTYGLGVQEALKDDPEREVDFVFRSHGTYLENIKKDFASNYPFPVETDYKYSAARMYSATHPPFFGNKFEEETKKHNLKSWMNVRNDDIFVYRWGNPNYAREYMKHMGSHYMAGFYMGSDGYVWGKEFTSKNPVLSGELEIQKHWYRELMWGRLAYNAELNNDFFKHKLKHHFQDTDVDTLFNLWNTASNIIPTLQSFHFKPGDSQWHVEGCVSMYGFATIRDFIDCPTINPKKIMTIPEYANAFLANALDERTTPLQIADTLLQNSRTSHELIPTIKKPSTNTAEFEETLADIEAMAYLGEYYAWKIKGTVAFYLYEATPHKSHKNEYRQSALQYLNNARVAWKHYGDNSKSRYKTQLLARTVELDWDKIYDLTQQDIAIVEASNGEKDKLVKMFVLNKNMLENKEFQPIQNTLKEQGFIPEMYPFSHIDSYVEYYTRIVMFSEDASNKEVKRMQKEGAKIPESYTANGFAIIKHKNIYWVMGKDRKHMIKAINKFINDIKI